jgi:hypothetical protein
MLGHASAVMTLDVYAGLFDDDLDAVAARLDATVRGVTASAADLRPSGSPGHAAQNGTCDPTLAMAKPTAQAVRGLAANTATGTNAEARRRKASIAGSRPDSANVRGLRVPQRPADTRAVIDGTTTAINAAIR